MGTNSSGRGDRRVPGDQDICRSCGVPTYPGEMFCVSCGAYMGWDTTGGSPTVVPEPVRTEPAPPGPWCPEYGRGDGPAWYGAQPGPFADGPTRTGTGPTGTSRPDTGVGASADPLFAPAAARPAPAWPQPEFTTPAEAGPWARPDRQEATGRRGRHAAPRSAHPMAPAAARSAAPDPLAAQTQVIRGEVVLWTTLPEELGVPPHLPRDAAPADGMPPLLLCPACRSHNAENRTYCRPCGTLLRPEPGPPDLTRWQQLREKYLERPDIWHWDRRLAVIAAALPVCMVAGMSLGSAAAAAERAIPLVKDRFLSQYAVAPDSVSASSSAKGFEAGLASDGVDNKAWAPKGTGQEAVGQYWTAKFQTPFRLTSLVLVNGASVTPGQFFETGRPTRITVSATSTDQGIVQREIKLAGQPGPQRFDLGIDNVVAVQVQIDSVHPGLKPGMPVAMAEIQFFSRQAS